MLVLCKLVPNTARIYAKLKSLKALGLALGENVIIATLSLSGDTIRITNYTDQLYLQPPKRKQTKQNSKIISLIYQEKYII